MGKDIKLSPKYGVNPSMTTCFWCGKTTGIALMGRISGGKRGGDIEAPKYVFDGYEPCPECQDTVSKGVMLMEADSIPVFEGQPEMQKGVYPTGRWCVMKKESAKRIFDCDATKAFVDKQTMDMLLCGAEEA